jgi:thioredoxin-like negative regulator of GroEL
MKQLLYFSAGWCSACKGVTPIIEQLVSTKSIPVNKIDTDYDVSYVEEYKIKSIPTIIVLENGNEIKRYTGPITLAQLQNLING